MSGWGIAETASVIEKIKAESADYLRGLNSCGDITWSVYDKAFDFYMELISRAYEQGKKDAQLETQWIPVGERLPEEYGEYLVTKRTIGWNCEEYDVNDIAYFDDDGFHKADRIIAWMPLPTPYTK